MRVSTHIPERIELIPENDEEKAALQLLLDNRDRLMVYWGDAGERFTPPEMLGGLILNTIEIPDLSPIALELQARQNEA